MHASASINSSSTELSFVINGGGAGAGATLLLLVVLFTGLGDVGLGDIGLAVGDIFLGDVPPFNGTMIFGCRFGTDPTAGEVAREAFCNDSPLSGPEVTCAAPHNDSQVLGLLLWSCDLLPCALAVHCTSCLVGEGEPT